MKYRVLCLNTSQLTDISLGFYREISVGLKTRTGQLACLPAYVHVGKYPSGRALVLDFGGTQLRAAIVMLNGEKAWIEKGPLSETIPLERGKPIDKKLFWGIQTALIARLEPESGLPLGYCFSYPIENDPDGDARLIKWTKGVQVPDMAGRPVGRMLLDALAAKGIHCPYCVVINDAVASLLAGVTQKKADAQMGLIAGTGTNMALLIDPYLIPKLNQANRRMGFVPVNLESGNFIPPYLTQWDDRVDEQSDNPGSQRFEKAISGAYLSHLMKAVLPDETIDTESGARQISRWAKRQDPCSDTKRRIARLILNRSANLVAAALAGAVMFLNEEKPVRSALISVEGGLILNSPDYHKMVESTLARLVRKRHLPTDQVDMVQITHANLFGGALAALSRGQAG